MTHIGINEVIMSYSRLNIKTVKGEHKCKKVEEKQSSLVLTKCPYL